MKEEVNYDKLDELRKDLSRAWGTLKEYHNNSFGNFAKNFGVCGLSAITLATPMYAFLETILPKIIQNAPEIYQYFPDMGVDDSIYLRSILAFPIMAWGYVGDKWRTKSRKNAKNGSIGHHDGFFGSKVSFVTNVIPYGVKFGGDLAKTGLMTLGSWPISYAIGRAEGFTTDFMKHTFLNEKPSERVPLLLKKASRKTKLGLAGLMVATSVGLTAGVYNYSNYLDSVQEKKEIGVNELERKTIEEVYPEFNRDSIESYEVQPDGLKVDTPKSFQK